MTKKDLVILADYSEESLLTFAELCEVCNITADFMNDLIEFEIIHPEGQTPDAWEFDLEELMRIKRAIRLQRDLEVNLPGIVIVLDLLEEMEKLRIKAELLEKHFLKE
jgi:chaperone modulatory protein CbpM